jgi:hypothetical protein
MNTIDTLLSSRIFKNATLKIVGEAQHGMCAA